jgi:hypothetical protein
MPISPNHPLCVQSRVSFPARALPRLSHQKPLAKLSFAKSSAYEGFSKARTYARTSETTYFKPNLPNLKKPTPSKSTQNLTFASLLQPKLTPKSIIFNTFSNVLYNSPKIRPFEHLNAESTL